MCKRRADHWNSKQWDGWVQSGWGSWHSGCTGATEYLKMSFCFKVPCFPREQNLEKHNVFSISLRKTWNEKPLHLLFFNLKFYVYTLWSDKNIYIKKTWRLIITIALATSVTCMFCFGFVFSVFPMLPMLICMCSVLVSLVVNKSHTCS